MIKLVRLLASFPFSNSFIALWAVLVAPEPCRPSPLHFDLMSRRLVVELLWLMTNYDLLLLIPPSTPIDATYLHTIASPPNLVPPLIMTN